MKSKRAGKIGSEDVGEAEEGEDDDVGAVVAVWLKSSPAGLVFAVVTEEP